MSPSLRCRTTWAKRLALAGDVETALGGQLLAALGDQGDQVRLHLVGDLHHLLRRRHLQIQQRLAGLAQQLEVAVLDVPAVLAEMDGDLTGPAASARAAAVTGSGYAALRAWRRVATWSTLTPSRCAM